MNKMGNVSSGISSISVPPNGNEIKTKNPVINKTMNDRMLKIIVSMSAAAKRI